MIERATAGPPDSPGLRLRLEAKLGILDDLVIAGFMSHGTRDAICVKGRVVERKGLSASKHGAGTIRTVLATVQRFRSDEIPGARVRIRHADRSWDVYTDDEGFFLVNLPGETHWEAGWHTVEARIVDSLCGEAAESTCIDAIVPREDAHFGILSDLDDTVVHTGATRTTTMLRSVFARPAAARTQMPGVAPFYRALAAGPSGDEHNPVFYLSRSGWNLYEPMQEFLRLNDLPRGPLMLQDLALREKKSRMVGAEFHKLQQTRMLLAAYPSLPFVLLGDSGQGDPETYRQIVHEYPGRIRAVYIRDVTADSRNREVAAIGRDLRDRGVAMIHADDSVAMARHAAHHGLIPRDAVDDVRAAV